MGGRWGAWVAALVLAGCGPRGGDGEAEQSEAQKQPAAQQGAPHGEEGAGGGGGGLNTGGGGGEPFPDGGPGGGGGEDPGGGGGGGGAPVGPGPWPTAAVLDYSREFSVGAVQSAAFDDGLNLWLLAGDRIGVLRPGDKAPRWTAGVGQAARGFGEGALALGSTVLCGGAAGKAYVGYAAADLSNPGRESPDDPEYLKGDLDLVRLQPDGKVALEAHVSQSVVYQGKPQQQLGIRNSNDWHYDEDRSVLTCGRLRTGPNKGDLFIGTNHGVTMIRGAVYNSHRHPVWDVNGSLRIGYSYGLGFAFDGSQVLIANEWKIGILQAPKDLEAWDRSDRNPWVLDTWVAPLGSLEEMDYWRGFTQAKDGAYYLTSARYGLWRMRLSNGRPSYEEVSGLPTRELGAVQATLDGSVYVGTQGSGLWRLSPQGVPEKVAGVSGTRVRQLSYEPSLVPSMLVVVTDAGVSVLRGP